jgi:hypothetical protein
VSAPGQADQDVAARIGRLAGVAVREVHRLGGQHQWGHYRVALADGRLAFAKVAAARLSAGLDGVFEAEARGLRWLAEAGAVPVPDVLGQDATAIAVSWLPGEAPSASAGTSPACTWRARPASAHPGRGSSPACRWAAVPGTGSTAAATPGTRGRSGTAGSGCCLMRAAGWMRQRCTRPTWL